MPLRNRTTYRKPRFPKGEFFVFVDERGIEDGPFRVTDFAQNRPDGEWVAQTAGHPVFLRIVKQQGDEIWTKDGAGKVHHLRMVPVTL